MNFKRKNHLVVTALMLVFATCGGNDNDYIPPALEPDVPDTPPTEDVYNEPEFKLHVEGEPFDTYRGLVMAGYQGWFGAPGDGCAHSENPAWEWYHYTEGGVFKPGVLRNSIDFWPDVSEYEKTYTPGVDGTAGRSAKFTKPDGKLAMVYSAYDESSVMLHFKWMQQYGIDGVFMQRFVGEVINNPAGKDHFDKVLEHAMKGSNQYGRAISVMYDLGGFMENGRDEKTVLADAQKIMDKYNLKDRTQQKFYLHEDGKPLLALWGVGFDEKPFDADRVASLIAALKAQGWSIMLGVNDDWRTHSSTKWPGVKYKEVVKSANIIFPWFVGRYGTVSDYENGRLPIIEADIQWCRNNGVIYAPHCFPGGADLNMHPNNGVVDRLGGRFLWSQIYGGLKAGAESFYIAMFDEIDEGTAIYKCLNRKDVPSDEADVDYWVNFYKNETYKTSTEQLNGDDVEWSKKDKDLNIVFQGIEDQLPTDHYLWLTGQARKMLRGEVPLKNSWPARVE